MKRSEIIGMNRMELKSRLQDNTEALRNLRFQKAMHQLENPLQLRYLRREIAQINTVLKELELKIIRLYRDQK